MSKHAPLRSQSTGRPVDREKPQRREKEKEEVVAEEEEEKVEGEEKRREIIGRTRRRRRRHDSRAPRLLDRTIHVIIVESLNTSHDECTYDMRVSDLLNS